MTDKDQELIDKAFEYTDGSDWNMIEELFNQAESDEALTILRNRQSYLYRKEENFSGL